MTRPAWTNVPLEAGDALIVRQIEIHRTDTHDVDKRQWRLALGFKILRKDRSFVRNVVGSSPFGYDYSVMRDRWPALLPSLSIGHSLDELAFYDRTRLERPGTLDEQRWSAAHMADRIAAHPYIMPILGGGLLLMLGADQTHEYDPSAGFFAAVGNPHSE